MKTTFYKYQGTGNDFIIIDNRHLTFKTNDTGIVPQLCDRKFGIGADGVILLQNKKGYDFEMVYYNADGTQSLCGNGSRCIVNFAKHLGIIKNSASFLAIDGVHEALVKTKGIVSLKMNDVKKIEANPDFYFLNTGSPHYVVFVKNVGSYPVVEEGKRIRNTTRFKKEGTNVNFVEVQGKKIFVRTYERGVENETLSCGTGVTACALVASLNGITSGQNYCDIKTPGGNLKVKFKKNKSYFSDIWLEGPAVMVYKGEVIV